MSAAKKRKVRKRRTKQKYLLLAALLGSFIFLLLGLTLSAFIFVAAATYKLPNLKNETLFKNAQTTKIFDSRGQLIANLFVEQNRIVVPLENISPYLQKAVIAMEDRRFYQHQGVDWKAIFRALATDVQEGKIVEGGSTLTQQYIKNTIVTPEKTFSRKIKEAALAYEIEKKWPKKKILEAYLNTIYFGQSAYGAETAAQTFFNKPAKDLTLAEAALLAGVIRAPNTYSPYNNLEQARARRNLVIETMLKQKLISKKEAEAALAEPINLAPLKPNNYTFPYFVEYVKQLILEDKQFGSTVSERANALFKGGLRIYTTIDPEMQQQAENAVWSVLNRPDDPVGSLVAIEPKTGFIRAMVGGRDFNVQKYNLAVQAHRQPGSSFKPFVLAAALEKGIPITKAYQSGPAVIRLPGQIWYVKNATEGKGGGLMDLRTATIHSVNAVFARLMMDVGPANVVDLVKKMGIQSPIEPVPAIALGGLGVGVSPLEMASAYTTFANGGFHTKPVAITKITDTNGNIIKENTPYAEPVLNPVNAYLIVDVLKDVINAGTGRRAQIGRPAAGKTGTTENYGDAWFVGFTPQLSTSVWVGYLDSRRPMRGVHGINVQGGTLPAEIWQKFMSQALAKVKPADFERPARGLIVVKICADMPGYLATQYCPNVITASFGKGQAPRQWCPEHKEPPKTPVPQLIGLSEAEAKSALEAIGLKVNVVYVESKVAPKGQVMAQEPEAGSELPKGAEVKITVSQGIAPLTKATVPKVVGLPEAQARAVLTTAGFEVTVTYVASDGSNTGLVVSQTPTAGTTAFKKTVITLQVAK